MPLTTTQRRALVHNGTNQQIRDRLIPATVGKVESDNSITVTVSGQTNKIWVRLYSADAQAQECRNMKITPLANLPVIVENTNTGLTVVGLDEERTDLLLGDNADRLNRAPLGELSDAVLPGRNYKPGRVRPVDTTSLRIHVEEFFYSYYGTLKHFAGATEVLTSYRPSTSGYWRFVYVCVNPHDNTLVLLSGSEVGNVALLDAEALTDFSAVGLNVRDAVRLQNGQTVFSNDLRDFQYGRILASSVGSEYLPTFPSTISSSYTYIPSGRKALWYGPITLTGTLKIEGSLRIIA